MVKVITYSFWTGLIKSIKNVAVTIGVPAVVVLINNYTEWMPEEWYPVAVPLISVVAYLLKNKIEFSARNK